MRKLLLLLLSFTSFTLLQAQTGSASEQVVKEWAFIGESNTHLDVSYRLVKCSGNSQIHLQVFNESPNNQVAKFTIEVVNVANDAKFNSDISFSVERAAIVQASCESGEALKSLKIDLPAGFDINNLRLKITFTL